MLSALLCEWNVSKYFARHDEAQARFANTDVVLLHRSRCENFVPSRPQNPFPVKESEWKYLQHNKLDIILANTCLVMERIIILNSPCHILFCVNNRLPLPQMISS